MLQKIKKVIQNNTGMGVIEVILIIVVIFTRI